MKLLLIFALFLCVHSEETSKNTTEAVQTKDKRQTQGEVTAPQLVYRTARKQERVAPVEENHEDERDTRDDTEQYRPGQVYSLNAQELLELQPERKAPVSSGQPLQQLQQLQLYSPQPEQKQIQPIYYLEPQLARQVAYQPSHAVIARPDYSSNGGEASVGAALSVSDSGANPGATFDQELLALLGQTVHQEEPRQQYTQTQQTPKISTQSVAPQYQQVDIPYIPKPSKKPTKLRPKVQITPPQSSTAPQQFLIETTNVQPTYQQPQQQYQPQQPQYQIQPQQYRSVAPTQRLPQTLRYIQIQPTQASIQQAIYERPESSGLKIVAAPKLQNLNPQYNTQVPQVVQPQTVPSLNYRILPQYQPEATPKQYRVIDSGRVQGARQEKPRILNLNERPVTYLKRFPDPAAAEGISQRLSQSQTGEQYYVRPLYRPNEQRARYDPIPSRAIDTQRSVDPTKAPLSSIYVSQGLPKMASRSIVRIDSIPKYEQPAREIQYRLEPSSSEQATVDQPSQSAEDQRSHLPPPRNNKAYTPEEFSALVAAGYSVTPIPVGQAAPGSQAAQSRSSVEIAPAPVQHRRLGYSRRNQYLPLRIDDAP